jgi:hypothetical protein
VERQYDELCRRRLPETSFYTTEDFPVGLLRPGSLCIGASGLIITSGRSNGMECALRRVGFYTKLDVSNEMERGWRVSESSVWHCVGGDASGHSPHLRM